MSMKCVPYSALIGQGKYWQKAYFKRLVGKYLANAIIIKTICTYIIIVFNAPEKMKYSQPRFNHVCGRKYLSMFEFTVNRMVRGNHVLL